MTEEEWDSCTKYVPCIGDRIGCWLSASEQQANAYSQPSSPHLRTLFFVPTTRFHLLPFERDLTLHTKAQYCRLITTVAFLLHLLLPFCFHYVFFFGWHGFNSGASSQYVRIWRYFQRGVVELEVAMTRRCESPLVVRNCKEAGMAVLEVQSVGLQVQVGI